MSPSHPGIFLSHDKEGPGDSPCQRQIACTPRPYLSRLGRLREESSDPGQVTATTPSEPSSGSLLKSPSSLDSMSYRAIPNDQTAAEHSLSPTGSVLTGHGCKLSSQMDRAGRLGGCRPPSAMIESLARRSPASGHRRPQEKESAHAVLFELG